MDLRAVLQTVTRALSRAGIDHALIGGLAMGAHGAGRNTQDVDFLADGSRAEDVDRLLAELGYTALHRTPDVGNYASDDPSKGRVDFVFARRPASLAMLRRARGFRSLDIELRVVDAEDLIGLKVQASSNDPRRRDHDRADIRRILQLVPGLDVERVRSYFRLFDREKELDEMLAELAPK